VRIETLGIDLKYAPDDKELTVGASGTMGVGDIEGAVKAGVSKTFFLKKPDIPVLKRQQKYWVEEFRDRISVVTGKMPDCGANADYDHPVCTAGRELEKVNDKLNDAEDPTWRARLSVGQAPLGQLPGVLKALFWLVVGLFQ
jgi:hypothetical protein